MKVGCRNNRAEVLGRACYSRPLSLSLVIVTRKREWTQVGSTLLLLNFAPQNVLLIFRIFPFCGGIHMCVHVHVHVCMCVHIEARSSHSVFLNYSLFYFLKPEPRAYWLARVTGRRAPGIPCLHLSSWDFEGACSHTQVSQGHWGSKFQSSGLPCKPLHLLRLLAPNLQTILKKIMLA